MSVPVPPQADAQPVELPMRDESIGTSERDEYANGYRHGWNLYANAMRELGPLYTHPGACEVKALRQQLAERDALLRRAIAFTHDLLNPISLRRDITAALSASAEPSDNDESED